MEADFNPNPGSDFLGVLKESSKFNEDPVETQKAMRNEWD